jgi:crossover junction endodeoxyribonuclease RuvC
MILCIDPGLSAMGMAVLDFDRRLVYTECIRTEKVERSSASESNVERAKLLSERLFRIAVTMEPKAIACESMSFPRNASSAVKLGVSWGVVASVSQQLDIPVFQESPQDIKKCLCGKKSAGKKEIMEKILTLYPRHRWPKHQGKINLSEFNHIADAVAAGITCFGEREIQLAIKMSGG